MMHESCRRRGPPWWPANEPWPPHRHGAAIDPRRRARFFRRFAIAALGLLVLALSGVFMLASILAARFQLVGWATSIPIVLAALLAAFVLLLAFSGMRRFAWPLRAVMEAADRVAGGNYATRVQVYGPPPMRALAHSFNTMTERLQGADQLRRNLMADVAHELRTPLSVLQGRLEGLIDGIYPRDDAQLGQLLEETHVLSRLIDDLRTLALSEAGVLELQKEPTDLAALAADVVRSFDGEAAAKSVSLTLTPSNAPAKGHPSAGAALGTPPVGALTEATLYIDPVRMREVFTNLLSNALRHTASGGAVKVSITNTNDGVSVAVADTGEGMPSEDVARIFDRFYKGSRSRGSGLGLTIAKGIVTAHGGTISASSQLGRGTTVTFTVPNQ